MQSGATQAIADQIDPFTGSGIAATACVSASAAPFSPFLSASRPTNFRFHRHPKIKGWVVKAHEFINSGPPALLNNPCCCRRVVFHSFLKHAMEVRHG
jgi:hypothetical protein